MCVGLFFFAPFIHPFSSLRYLRQPMAVYAARLRDLRSITRGIAGRQFWGPRYLRWRCKAFDLIVQKPPERWIAPSKVYAFRNEKSKDNPGKRNPPARLMETRKLECITEPRMPDASGADFLSLVYRGHSRWRFGWFNWKIEFSVQPTFSLTHWQQTVCLHSS